MTRTGNKNLRQRFHSQPETHFFDRPLAGVAAEGGRGWI